MIKEIIKYTGTTHPKITHEDQEKNGLKFRILPIIAGQMYIVVTGNDTGIADYMKRNTDMSLSSVTKIKNNITTEPATRPCEMCGGIGKLPNPLYQIDKKI